MTKSIIVLGARDGNIGGAIASRMDQLNDWVTVSDDCYRDDLRWAAPKYVAADSSELGKYDACVITLGVTDIRPFGDTNDWDIHKVIYGCLELPLTCANNYVRGRRQCGMCGGRMMRAGSLDVCRECGANRQADGGGTIIFIGSYAHNHPLTNSTAYCAAKAGLDMACRSLAWELMPEFKVHIIHPHHVTNTPMSEKVLECIEDTQSVSRMMAEEYTRKDLRMPNLLTADEVAAMVEFLLTVPAAAWTSGSGINMFGGSR